MGTYYKGFNERGPVVNLFVLNIPLCWDKFAKIHCARIFQLAIITLEDI